uniref:ATP synthase F0 subunit 8 n=1 Tax=Metallyticus sp. JZ-2017 TaxID=2033292 RepID=A0A343UMS2_9NEOP|nr:ATP synthase F0 subunit 8 [Metallyticus sp. JZ-2017]
MPQMMPMSWMCLMLYFTFMLMFFNIMTYYININKPLFKCSFSYKTITSMFNW